MGVRGWAAGSRAIDRPVTLRLVRLLWALDGVYQTAVLIHLAHLKKQSALKTKEHPEQEQKIPESIAGHRVSIVLSNYCFASIEGGVGRLM